VANKFFWCINKAEKKKKNGWNGPCLKVLYIESSGNLSKIPVLGSTYVVPIYSMYVAKPSFNQRLFDKKAQNINNHSNQKKNVFTLSTTPLSLDLRTIGAPAHGIQLWQHTLGLPRWIFPVRTARPPHGTLWDPNFPWLQHWSLEWRSCPVFKVQGIDWRASIHHNFSFLACFGSGKEILKYCS